MNMMSSLDVEHATPTSAPRGFAHVQAALHALGVVAEVHGGSAKVLIDIEAMDMFSHATDSAVAQAGHVGSHVKICSGDRWIVGSVRDLVIDRRSTSHIIATVDFMGEGSQEAAGTGLGAFRRGITHFPVPGMDIYPVTEGDLDAIYAPGHHAAIELGTVYGTRSTRAALLVDSFLGRHFALLGSTGTGKSTAAALILHRICQMSTEGHIVMIDPHGEYGAAFQSNGELFDTGNLELPYWLMNFEEHCEVLLTSHGPERAQDVDVLARCLLAARAKSRLASEVGRLTVDTPIPYLLSDLSTIINNEMGRLDKGTGTLPYLRIKSRLDEIRNDPRYSFMFSGMLVADNMAAFLAKLFRLPANGRPISVIDVSSVPSEITHVVVSVLARLVFDFALWSRQEQQKPILLVCEEAHRYIPAGEHGQGQAVRRILERIAKEGRKYGVSLGLITQRPSDLAEGVLSQCGTIISMRLNNERDQHYVKAAMPEGARGFLDAIPALRNRECIVCGEGVSIPQRVNLDNLDEALRPASADPVFSDQWRRTGGEADILLRTIDRWRHGGR